MDITPTLPTEAARSVIGAASDKHRAQMQALSDFCGATVEYTDLGHGENYLLSRGTTNLLLCVRGNKMDGGYLSISSSNR